MRFKILLKIDFENDIMNVGIYGGSFDPIHIGHLLVAEFCREAATLDEVWFVPASVAPHKTTGASASAKHRLEMPYLTA